MIEEHEFMIGGAVLCLTDGDIGIVTDVRPFGDDPYYVEWYVNGDDTGWTRSRDYNTDKLVLVPLVGRQ